MAYYAEYYNNGNLKSKGVLEDGKKQGKWLFFYEELSLAQEINYKDDLEEGEWKRWYKNGNIHIITFMNGGVHHGPWLEHYENGKKRESGIYKDGEYHTVMDWWDEHGN